ncbi:NAD(P)-dependent oxidoreductase [bacterium SCSIO 12741]|nr:NAD(P)-dependent oxidoreductase [bacterium SCSIO 12741]
MIVGNGLVARSCASLKDREDLVIFASGVANSGEKLEDPFNREWTLLQEYMDRFPDKKFVYFSTCSVFDPSKSSTAYVQFKRKVEALLLESKRALVVRLPILVGPTSNPNQFCNFLYNQITSGGEFELHTEAERYLFWSGDLAAAISAALTQSDLFEINVCHPNATSVSRLVEIMEEGLGQKARYQKVHKGDRYSVDTQRFETLIEKDNHRYLQSPEEIITQFLTDKNK